MAGNIRSDPRAFVLGLDGVPWQLIQQWTDAGKLTNFGRLVDEGAGGPLESTRPATTPVAWPSIATGVSADKHGIYGWRSLSPEYSHRMYTGSDIAVPYLWDMLTPAVGANVPMTYPAREMDGEMVTGLMTPEIGDGFTHPPELRSEIESAIPDYQVGLYWEEYDGPTDEFRGDLRSLVERRRELMELLMEREDWRLFFFVFTAPDRLQHLVWDETVLLEHYQYLDDILGDVMSYVRERDATLYVASDHGFGPVTKHVSVNHILADKGYLYQRSQDGLRGTLAEVGITRDSVMTLLSGVGIDEDTVVDHLPRSLVDSVATQIPGDNVLYDVDFEQTRAFLHGPGNVYVNSADRFTDAPVDPADAPMVKREVADLLSGVTDPETGERVLEVSDGDELFPEDEHSPDLVVEGVDGYEVVNTCDDDTAIENASKMAASHRSEGIIFAWGPDIKAGTRLTDASVYDLMPTVLHGAGLPVPETADGTVLTDVFAPESTPATADVRTSSKAPEEVVDAGGAGRSDETEDFDDVEERLRGLGYME